MNQNYTNIAITVGVVLTSVLAIIFINDYLHVTNPLQSIQFQKTQQCNIDCKQDYEKNGYKCTNLKDGQYSCISPDLFGKNMTNNLNYEHVENIKSFEVFSPWSNYDDLYYYPINTTIQDAGIYSSLSRNDTMDVTFTNTKIDNKSFTYTTTLKNGQGFVFRCNNNPELVYFLKFVKTSEINGTKYVVFLVHSTPKPTMLDCERPDIIRRSIELNVGNKFDPDLINALSKITP